jgi:hypothetical protein
MYLIELYYEGLFHKLLVTITFGFPILFGIDA